MHLLDNEGVTRVFKKEMDIMKNVMILPLWCSCGIKYSHWKEQALVTAMPI